LNTPLVFSEKWNVMPTTFDAVVLVNSALQSSGVTLVGAYVSKSNTHGSLGNFNTLAGQIAVDGAYAAAAIYAQDEYKGQLWFYNVPTVVNAVWADGSAKFDNIGVTLQLASIMPDEGGLEKHLSIPGLQTADTTAAALKVSYKMNATTLCIAGSYTSAPDTGEVALNVANFGTFSGLGGVKTKLATATISGDGDVAGSTDTTSYKLKVVQDFQDYGKAIVQIAQYVHGEDSNSKFKDETATVAELIYKWKMSGMNMLLAYIYDKNVDAWNSELDDEAQTIRLVARYNF
jgi:hypothetical protein